MILYLIDDILSLRVGKIVRVILVGKRFSQLEIVDMKMGVNHFERHYFLIKFYTKSLKMGVSESE